jgi:hypothetical protein
MISDTVRRKARFYSALRCLELQIAAPLEDHPAVSRFDRLQDLRAAVEAADRAYRDMMHDNHNFKPQRFFEASGLADVKLKKLRDWWFEAATAYEAVIEVERRHAQYQDIIFQWTGPIEQLARWQALRDQCVEILKAWDARQGRDQRQRTTYRLNVRV